MSSVVLDDRRRDEHHFRHETANMYFMRTGWYMMQPLCVSLKENSPSIYSVTLHGLDISHSYHAQFRIKIQVGSHYFLLWPCDEKRNNHDSCPARSHLRY